MFGMFGRIGQIRVISHNSRLQEEKQKLSSCWDVVASVILCESFLVGTQNSQIKILTVVWSWIQQFLILMHYVFGLSTQAFVCSFIRLDRYCYHDILWTPWIILKLMEYLLAPTDDLIS